MLVNSHTCDAKFRTKRETSILVTNTRNSEQCFETIFGPKTFFIENGKHTKL